MAVPDFPDHARLLPTVFTTTERPPNDLEDLVTSPHDHLLFPITPDCFEQFKTVGNTSTEFTDLPGPYRTSRRPFPTSHRPYKTFPDHQGRERSASKSAKCDRGFSFFAVIRIHFPILLQFITRIMHFQCDGNGLLYFARWRH